jgi:hypothetical protein
LGQEFDLMGTDRQADKPQRTQLDDTVEQSFPASDPPAHSGVTGPGKPRRQTGSGRSEEDSQQNPATTSKSGNEARPAGSPTPDRHRTETSHGGEQDETTPRR